MKTYPLLLVLGACGLSLAAAADSRIGINIRIGAPPPVVVREAPPPAIVVEEHEHLHRMAAPGPGYVWIPRHHRWANGRWERMEGMWVVPPQPGARWVEGRWDPRSQAWTDEHWEITTTTAYSSAPTYYPPQPSMPPPPPSYGQPAEAYPYPPQPHPGYATAGEVEVRMEMAPPPPRREVVAVRPSRQHVWVPGYWVAEHGRHEWVTGRWELPPEGHKSWVQPKWERRGGNYVFVRGYWK